MPVFEVTSRVTRRSLMKRTKDELASRVLELMDLLDQERARRQREVKALQAVIQRLHPGGIIVRVDQPKPSSQPGLAGFLSEFRGVAWTDDPERTEGSAVPEFTTRPVSYAGTVLHDWLRAAADAGQWTPPEGMTVDDVLAKLTVRTEGEISFGDQDVEVTTDHGDGTYSVRFE